MSIDLHVEIASVRRALAEHITAADAEIDRQAVENARLRAECEALRVERDTAKVACRMAFNAFERGDCIDWSVVEAAAKGAA